MGTGRKKIVMKKIDSVNNLRAAFTKRRQGLFKKAAELCSLTGCRVAVLTFSSGNKPFFYGDASLLEAAAAAGSYGDLNGIKVGTLAGGEASLDVGNSSDSKSEEEAFVSGSSDGGDDQDLLFTGNELDELIASYTAVADNAGCVIDAGTNSCDMRMMIPCNDTISNYENAFQTAPPSSSSTMNESCVDYNTSPSDGITSSLPAMYVSAVDFNNKYYKNMESYSYESALETAPSISSATAGSFGGTLSESEGSLEVVTLTESTSGEEAGLGTVSGSSDVGDDNDLLFTGSELDELLASCTGCGFDAVMSSCNTISTYENAFQTAPSSSSAIYESCGDYNPIYTYANTFQTAPFSSSAMYESAFQSIPYSSSECHTFNHPSSADYTTGLNMSHEPLMTTNAAYSLEEEDLDQQLLIYQRMNAFSGARDQFINSCGARHGLYLP